MGCDALPQLYPTIFYVGNIGIDLLVDGVTIIASGRATMPCVCMLPPQDGKQSPGMDCSPCPLHVLRGYLPFFILDFAAPELGVIIADIIGVILFVGLTIIGLGLCVAFPEIILWLPGMMIE